MRELYLVRHAKAIHAFDVPDHERCLSKEGLDEASSIKSRFFDFTAPSLILCSSAVRTKQTMEKLFEGEIFPKVLVLDSLYNSTVSDYLDALHFVSDAHSSVAIFGHHPVISGLLHFLSNKHSEFELGTANVIKLTLPATNSWKDITEYSCTIADVITPKQ